MLFTLPWTELRYKPGGGQMRKSDGAKVWARVLSELAEVQVAVEWERPAWQVYWQDGPTREALTTRATALSKYRVGAPLPADELRFIRSNSVTAIALGWLANGAARQAAVETWCEGTGYPELRFDDQALAQADLLARLGRGDTAEMGALLAEAVPPVTPNPMQLTGPELTGRVTSYRWSADGPPEELLGPETPPAGAAVAEQPPTCRRCGRSLPPHGRGRPAKYCSGACRVAAHRAAVAAA
jgi:hypothetical protein